MHCNSLVVDKLILQLGQIHICGCWDKYVLQLRRIQFDIQFFAQIPRRAMHCISLIVDKLILQLGQIHIAIVKHTLTIDSILPKFQGVQCTATLLQWSSTNLNASSRHSGARIGLNISNTVNQTKPRTNVCMYTLSKDRHTILILIWGDDLKALTATTQLMKHNQEQFMFRQLNLS